MNNAIAMSEGYCISICHRYGIPCLLMLLKMLENEEYYEECQVIKDTLDLYAISTEVSDLNISTTTDYWVSKVASITKTSGEVAVSNMPYYVMDVFNEFLLRRAHKSFLIKHNDKAETERGA